jgi:hypothetical protein
MVSTRAAFGRDSERRHSAQILDIAMPGMSGHDLLNSSELKIRSPPGYNVGCDYESPDRLGMMHRNRSNHL